MAIENVWMADLNEAHKHTLNNDNSNNNNGIFSERHENSRFFSFFLLLGPISKGGWMRCEH